MTQTRLESIRLIQRTFPEEVAKQIVFHSHPRMPENFQREIEAAARAWSNPFNRVLVIPIQCKRTESKRNLYNRRTVLRVCWK